MRELADDPTTPESEVYIWHVWPARHWPSSSTEESIFIKELSSLAKLEVDKILPHERGDTTTVLNALRNGLALQDLLRVVPGVVPARLLSAYRHLDNLRASALEAFSEILAKPTQAAVVDYGNLAATLLPVPTFHIVAAITSRQKSEIRKAITEAKALMSSTMQASAEYEERLVSSPLSHVDKIRLGRVLYDPYAGGVWSHPYYTPLRVGTLVPERVRDLLGERDQ